MVATIILVQMFPSKENLSLRLFVSQFFVLELERLFLEDLLGFTLYFSRPDIRS